MKKLLLAVTFLLSYALAQAGPTTPADMRWSQNLDLDPASGVTTRYLSVPAAGATCAAILSGTTRMPHCYLIGTGLTVTNNTITANAQVPADWNAVSGPAAIVNKPTFATIAYSADWADLVNKPATWAPSPHTHAWADIVSGKPTTLAGYGITDGLSAGALTGYATTSALSTGLAGKFNQPTGTTAQYVRGDGTLATLPAASTINFSLPTARTIAASTSYQATDPSKPAIIVPSYACQNATTVLAASGCTLQVRMGTGTLTCSTGTVYYTQSLTVGLGLLLTQNSTNPVQINLPIGASFAICPTAGTFTITAVEQAVG